MAHVYFLMIVASTKDPYLQLRNIRVWVVDWFYLNCRVWILCLILNTLRIILPRCREAYPHLRIWISMPALFSNWCWKGFFRFKGKCSQSRPSIARILAWKKQSDDMSWQLMIYRSYCVGFNPRWPKGSQMYPRWRKCIPQDDLR